MGEAYCYDCKKATKVVTDRSVGDTICTECGLVVESYSIDETSEWRTFANESDNNIDPVRVGEPTNPLLTEGWFSTIISKPDGFINSMDIIMSNFDKMLTVAFKKIDTMADRLGLVARIKYRANEIYKDIKSQRSRMRRNKEDALMAACIFIACRREDLPRTLKEIWPVANGATKNEIIKAVSLMERQRTK